jgi:hypothetical protein
MTALCIYRFDARTTFAGEIVSAIDRMQGRAGPHVLDALFVMHDAEARELRAVDLGTGLADGTLAGLLDFRLDPGRRRAITERTLAGRAGGLSPLVVETIGAALEPGCAMLAVLVDGNGSNELHEAVSRAGGHLAADERVDASALADVAPQLRDAL